MTAPNRPSPPGRGLGEGRATKRTPKDRAALEPIERCLARGEWAEARAALLPLLEARAAAGDAAAGLAARMLRAQAADFGPPEALAEPLDRLLALVEQQEAQIRTLRALLEAAL